MEDILKNKDIIFNLDYIVCIPEYDYNLYDAFKFSFKNVILIKDNISDINNIIAFIKRNNIKQIICVDFLLEYYNIFKTIDLDIEIKFILTKTLASMTNIDIYSIVNSVLELHKKNVFQKLGVLDINWYDCLKNRNIDVEFLRLDIQNDLKQKNIDKSSSTIGIISEEYNANHSYFNELSAIKLNGKYTPNLNSNSNIINDFTNIFNIDYKYSGDIDIEEYISNNIINLYINFTDNNNILFLKSMDQSVPCILGNTNLLKDFPYLQKSLTVKSDDNIDEIAEKIDQVIESREEIFNQYKDFRKEYSEKSKKSIKAFLGSIVYDDNDTSENNDILLSVIVPVYNTEKYISECLDSIIESKFDSMEILIINDGSTDNSEDIIKDYVEKYPKIIRYIKQENHGLGNVRNVGLKKAKGKYILSVDSDDTINAHFLNEAKRYIENDVDIIMCDWLSIPESGDSYETAALDYIFKDIIQYKGLLYTTIMPSTCNKIIKKSLFKKINYDYVEGLKYEDLSLNPIIMIKAESIKYINKPYYEYKIRGNSIMRTSAGYDMIDVLQILDDRINSLFGDYCKVNIEEFKFYTYIWRIEEFIFNQIYDMGKEKADEFIRYTISKIEHILKEVYLSERFEKYLVNVKETTKQYILKRNESLRNGNLLEFLNKAIEDKSYIKITPPMFFWGEK